MACKVACLFLLLAHGAVAARSNAADLVELAGMCPGMKIKSYTLVRKLGSGADGEVWEASDLNDNLVAAKFVPLRDKPTRDAFTYEAKTIETLMSCPGYPHPNILNVHEVFSQTLGQCQKPGARRSTLYDHNPSEEVGVSIMDLAKGGALNRKLYKSVSAEAQSTEGERLDFGTALLVDEGKAKDMFAQLASGIRFLAKCGIVHQDLKPDNIMVDESSGAPVLKIGDFGRSIVINGRPTIELLPNMFYRHEAGPRQEPNEAVRFDVFGLGMLLAEIGTGVPPYFNPPHDYYSTKGNLKDQPGIIYAKWPDKRKGNTGRSNKEASLYWAITALSNDPRLLEVSVGEVAGRQMYYLQKGSHFPRAFALEDEGGKPIDEDFKRLAWLYSDPQALDLLKKMVVKVDNRIDPDAVCNHAWLEGRCDSLPQEMRSYQQPTRSVPMRGRQEEEEVDPYQQPKKNVQFSGYQEEENRYPQPKKNVQFSGYQEDVNPNQQPKKSVQFSGHQDESGFGGQNAMTGRGRGVTMRHPNDGQQPQAPWLERKQQQQQPQQFTGHQEQRGNRAQTMLPKSAASQDLYYANTGKQFQDSSDSLNACTGVFTAGRIGGGDCELYFNPDLMNDCIVTLMCPRQLALQNTLQGLNRFVIQKNADRGFSSNFGVNGCRGCQLPK